MRKSINGMRRITKPGSGHRIRAFVAACATRSRAWEGLVQLSDEAGVGPNRFGPTLAGIDLVVLNRIRAATVAVWPR